MHTHDCTIGPPSSTGGSTVRLTIDQGALLNALHWVTRAVSARPAAPILTGVVLKANSALELSGFDYEMSTNALVEAHIDERGETLVGGHLLTSLIRSLPPTPVTIETQGNEVTVGSAQTTFTLPMMPLADYPTTPSIPEVLGSVKADDFLQAVTQTSVAADHGNALPILGGVYLESEGSTLYLVSTDRYRVAVRTLDWSPRDGDFTALVPARNLQQFSRAFDGASQANLLGTSQDMAVPSLGILLPTRSGVVTCLDGTYVPWRKLTKHAFTTRIELEVAPLLEAMKRVSLVAGRQPVELSFTDGEATLRADSDTNARAIDSLPAQIEGEDVTVIVNPGYFISGLSGMHTETVIIECNGPLKPMQLSTTDEIADAPGFRYVLMPIRP